MDAAFDVGPIEGSELALEARRLDTGTTTGVGDGASDTLLYVASGSGRVTVGGEDHDVRVGSAALVVAGEQASVSTESGLGLVVATVGPGVDLHAPMGRRDVVLSRADAEAEKATGVRSFQILFGPHNGSTRATLFAGFIPPGKAPWHYHLYDEIVWIPEGPGRLHLDDASAELGAGATFRLRPRQVHIVENASVDRQLTIIGIFTPAGSPSAAYLTSEAAAEYSFVG